jgi:hypothetical protein
MLKTEYIFIVNEEESTVPDMKLLHGALFSILLMVCLVVPASAFTAHTLTIQENQNGDAQMDFTYELNWLEQVAVFTKIADPGTELKSALEHNFPVSVDIISVDNHEASFIVHPFATVTSLPEGTRYVTPKLSFANAQRALNKYWFAPLISLDLSPDVTRVIFPDGYAEEFYNQIDIPSVSHTVSA